MNATTRSMMSASGSIVLEINGERMTVPVPDVGNVTADQMNRLIGSAFVHVRADMLPRALTPEEARAAQEKHQREHRPKLITAIRSYPEQEIAEALKAAKRKGWGLEGMSTAKLEEVERHLRLNAEDEADDY